MRVDTISGFGVKGPAAFLAEIDGRRLLLDCGEGPDGGRRPDLSAIGTLDAVLVSHGHMDHIGALDLVAGRGVPVHLTRPVWELAGRLPGHVVHFLPLRGTTEIAGLRVTTGRNGHAPGGVWIHIAGRNPAEGLLYTGDVSRESGLYPYDSPPAARLAVADASYGDYDEPLDHGADALLAMAAKGPLLLPAPADGRGLEMAGAFVRAGLAVRLCPAHRQAAEIALGAQDEVLIPAGRDALASALDSAPLDEDAQPHGVMIAAKAGLGGGLARRLAGRWQEDTAVRIVFTGHAGAGTPARALIGEGRAAFVRWNVHPRLSHLRELLASVGAEQVLPAFLDRGRLPALSAALPQIRLSTSGTMRVEVAHAPD